MLKKTKAERADEENNEKEVKTKDDENLNGSLRGLIIVRYRLRFREIRNISTPTELTEGKRHLVKAAYFQANKQMNTMEVPVD